MDQLIECMNKIKRELVNMNNKLDRLSNKLGYLECKDLNEMISDNCSSKELSEFFSINDIDCSAISEQLLEQIMDQHGINILYYKDDENISNDLDRKLLKILLNNSQFNCPSNLKCLLSDRFKNKSIEPLCHSYSYYGYDPRHLLLEHTVKLNDADGFYNRLSNQFKSHGIIMDDIVLNGTGNHRDEKLIKSQQLIDYYRDYDLYCYYFNKSI